MRCTYLLFVLVFLVLLLILVVTGLGGRRLPLARAVVLVVVLVFLVVIFPLVIVIVLILSEVGWPAAFFRTYFPVLGPDFGLGALGIFQCLIGATILSHHVDDFTLVAAFFLFSVGCLNMLIGLFREKVKRKRSIMSWREEAKGILPTHKDLRPPFVRSPQAFTKMDDDDVYGETYQRMVGTNGHRHF